MSLGDERHALLPALLDGRVFTHRLSASEIEHSLVTVTPDLEPLPTLADTEPTTSCSMASLWWRSSPTSTPSCSPNAASRSTRSVTRQCSSSRRISFLRWACARETWPDSVSQPPVWTSPRVEEGDVAANVDVGSRLSTILAECGGDEPKQLDSVVWTARG